jgi:LytR cell envelope-related transcriptional attenuator
MNDGAFRGIVLVAVAVVIGLILLGSGLDDTVSTARVDDSASSSDDGGGSDDSAPEDSSVGSPLSPSEINVIVANGAGVEGAAATISATLSQLGYTPLEPTNTTVPAESTPLDSIYYQTSPNTQAQAEKVAEDLGVSPSAVLPYPAEGAPAPIGLAQVLVVLGSSENQLATTAGGGTTPSSTTLPAG